MFSNTDNGNYGSQGESVYPGAFSSVENLQYLLECLSGSKDNSTICTCNLDHNEGTTNQSFDLGEPHIRYQTKRTRNKGKNKKRRLIKHQCTCCGKEFSSRNIASHLRTHQKERDTHKCGLCDKVYFRNSDLNQHKKDNHELQIGTKEFIASQTKDTHTCGVCNKDFGKVQRLILHRKEHNDSRL